MKILIAEKGTVLHYLMIQIVKAVPGPKVIDEVSDGNDAMLKIFETNYDFVVLDVFMYGMSGLDILQKMRDNNNNTRTLIYSSIPQEEFANRAINLGAAGYFSQNTALEVLRMAVEQASEEANKLASYAQTEDKVFNKGKVEARSLRERIADKKVKVVFMLTNGHSSAENLALTIHVG